MMQKGGGTNMQDYFGKTNLPISDVSHGENITLVYRNDDNVVVQPTSSHALNPKAYLFHP